MFKDVVSRLRSLSPIEVFVILSLISFLFFVVKFFGIRSDWHTIRVEVVPRIWTQNFDNSGYKSPFWLSSNLRPGQTQKNINGKDIARIVSIESFDRGGDESEVFMNVEVEVAYNKRQQKYYFQDKPLDTGESIELNFNNSKIFAQIIDNNVPGSGYPTRDFQVTFLVRGLEPWYSQKVNVGDKMINRNTGQTILEIEEIKTSPSTLQTMQLQNRQILKSDTSSGVDLTITARTRAHLINNQWYFAGHKLLKPSNFVVDPPYLALQSINLSPVEIINLKELP